jgi:ATP-dependent exoDNAse (exonuclease V) beta subunit
VKIDVVSASAGTGKTYRLTEELTRALLDGTARPEGVVAITYTVKAAGELGSRIRAKLLSAGRADLAARVRDGYLGTIHSVCQRLLRELALEAGLSPWLEPIPEAERQRLFDVAVAGAARGMETELNDLARRLELEDWKARLLEIVDAARNNGMDAAALDGAAAESRAGLSRLFGPVTVAGPGYLKRLKAAHAKLQPVLDERARGTVKADKDRAALGRRLSPALDRGAMPSWKSQLQLAKAVDMKMLQAWSGDLVEVVNEHLGCAAFQDDVFGLQAKLFALAGQALDGFVAEKAAARVVDFGDMLARARDLLALPAVQEALRARLDLVLVDEFQDTSPLQLAVVAALGAVAKRSVWVGDRKQAIFGFQGSDPELMTAATEAALGARPPDILSRSWRSRPDLVAMVSSLFTGALAPHGFPEAQVRLTANPDAKSMKRQPAFALWRWEAEKREEDGAKVSASEPHALAAGVEALLAHPPLVRERASDPGAEPKTRPATWRDVAILARSNARCQQIAEALRARGIPAKVSLTGLTGTPEAVLARAALALLADPSDGVAAFEVGWLGGGASADADGWLSGRLSELAAWRAQAAEADAKGARPPSRPLAFASDPRIAALRGAAKEAARLSPAEALDLALREAAIPAHVRAWPDPAQRLANLEALRAEALAYEQLCAAQRTAGTVLGLVAHLAQLGDDDQEGKQAAASSEDAVTVATWHKAKGLEWPVVVLSHLDHWRERSVFAVAVEPAPAFDFARPLEGRRIRWWPWPYGGLSSNLALLDKALKTPEAERATERDLREQLRLLYVGFTRPRDLLVLAAKVSPKSGPALKALGLLRGADGTELLDLPFEEAPGPHELSVADESWGCTVAQHSGLPPAAVAARRRPVPWYAPAPRAERGREKVNPSREPLPGLAQLVSVQPLGARQAVHATAELAGAVGDAIHAFLAADRPGDARARTAMAARLLEAHRVADAIATDTLLAASDALRTWLEPRYPGATWLREWPVRARLPGPPPRLLVGEVDLALELPDGFVLIDHKSFPGAAKERDRRVVEEYAPQLRWYARALAAALKKPMVAAFVHFPVRGEIAEVRLE